MAATSSSAQRSSRSGRTPISKKEAPTRTRNTANTGLESTANLVKEERSEKDSSTASVISSDESKIKQEESDNTGIASTSSLSSSQQQPLIESNADPQAQPRRSMTRTRKPSSRLMPSPSPPPARTSSYHYNNSKPSAALATTSTSTLLPMGKSMPKKAAPLVSPTPPVPVLTARTDVNNIAEQSEEIEFGPGKRKRRPSTMTKPPSTIIKATPSAVAAQFDASVLSSSNSAATLKVRLPRVPSKSQTPEDKSTKEKSITTKKAAKTDQSLKDQSLAITSDNKSITMIGSVSEGNKEASRLIPPTDQDAGQDRDNDSEAGQAPRPSRKIILGRSKSGRDKMAMRTWPYPPMHSAFPGGSAANMLEPPPLISRRGGLKLHQPFSQSTQRIQKVGSSSDNMPSHLRSHSTSVLDGKWAWTSGVLTPTLRFRLACHDTEEDSSEVSDMEDEDDFHVAMLKGDDFVETHYRTAASLSSKDSHHDSKSGDDSDAEDTPATTPRSPQSICELPERRWSTGADEDDKEVVRSAARDAVFAHALESSSHRPHTHAGALTLSLPYQEVSQGVDEEISARPSDVKSKYESREEGHQDEDEAVLMSPAVHHGLLGLSTKQHNMMLSSPQVSSAFISPALDAIHSTKVDGIVPLTLPPARRVASLTSEEVSASATLDSQEVLDASQDEEQQGHDQVAVDMYDRSGVAVEPVESMCLTELEQAWEQSEVYNKLSKEEIEMSKKEGKDVLEEIQQRRGEKEKENKQVQEKEEEQSKLEKTPRRSSKRFSAGTHQEEREAKKLRSSPIKAKAATTPSPARRSKRQSGIRV